MKRNVKFLIFMVLIFCSTLLVGCQSTDKAESYIGTGDDFTCSYSYNAEENRTDIIIDTYIYNNTIYTIDKVTLVANLYLNDTLVKQDAKITFDFEVGYSEIKNHTFYTYYAGGEVNKLEYISWSASYKSLWDTYFVWFLVTIIIVALIAVILILVMIIQDLELDDIIDFLKERWWIVSTIFIPYLKDGILHNNWCWVPLLIMAGGVVALIVIALLALFIKYLITDVF